MTPSFLAMLRRSISRPFPLLVRWFWLSGLTWASQAAVRGAEPSGQFFRDWLLCGPMPAVTAASPDLEVIRLPGMGRDWLQAAGGESSASPKAGDMVVIGDQRAVWTLHTATNDVVDLDSAVTRTNGVVAYAYREIVSDRDVACFLAFGSNDGARVWWNGEEVVDAPGARGLSEDHNVVPVALRRGTNRILVKVEERGNQWRLACRLLPLDHAGYPEALRVFEVRTKTNGLAEVRSRVSHALLKALVRRAVFEARSEAEPGRVEWRAEWKGESVLPVMVDSSRFGAYRFSARVELAEGQPQEWTAAFTAGRREEYVVWEGGRSSWRIVVDPDASESERWAASELQQALEKIGGVRVPVENFTADRATSGHLIHVGWNPRVSELLGGTVASPAAEDESFRYCSVRSELLIWGGRQRGTMHGVVSFLERELGVRFYTPKVTVMPRRDRWSYVGLNHREAPSIRVRNDFYFEAFDPVWAARNRMNGAMTPRAQPGGVETYWSVHTFYPLVPPEEFFASHPEYFSLIGGVRTHERAQLCLSHPEVFRILVERLRRRMKESPEYLIYDVSQNDWAGPCECRNCQAIVDREGSQSGPVLEFVNRVADALGPEFPGKFIGTLAYQYTRKPPRTVKPRENVVVRFCSIECCFAHPFTECARNRSFVEDMDGWAKIAPHLYIWDYVVNFSHYVMPYPNFRVLAPNLRFFRDHRAIGIMEQGAYQSRGGEFAELRAYVLARLLWNPDQPVEPIVSDFMHGFYGRAGQYVQAYFDRLHAQLAPETHLGLGLQPDDRLFTDDFIADAVALFDAAERVAEDDAVRHRVELARLPLMYLQCKRTPGQAKRDGTYERLKEIAAREGVSHFAEAGEPHSRAFHAEMDAAR